MMFALWFVMVPTPAWAEVMDKEPGLGQVWFWGLAGVLAIFLAGRIRWWLAWPAALLPALFFIGLIQEMGNPLIGPSMWRESGQLYGSGWVYWISVYMAAAMAIVTLLGVGVSRPLSRSAKKSLKAKTSKEAPAFKKGSAGKKKGNPRRNKKKGR